MHILYTYMCMCVCVFMYIYRSLAKKRPWAVHLTLGSNWGVGGHSRNHRCALTRKSAQVYTLRSYTCTYVTSTGYY